MQIPLPSWITQDQDRPSFFRCDPDLYYPATLEEVAPGAKPTQYTLELAHNFLKMDARLCIRLSGLKPQEGATTLIVEGAEGYKERWGWRHHPPGEHAALRDESEAAYNKQVATDAAALYKRIRGVMPV